ncbi:MAG: two-component sensor histidine kinase [Pseudobdellovibrionaceae bacterium]|nr:MAG: two-component sensor histidine kinase [Pseudobdellovibrionaceae bacterium]
MKIRSKSPKRSLRTILVSWFMFFSLVPLAFITGYALVKYEQVVDQELVKRLKGNQREIEGIFADVEDALTEKTRSHSTNNSLVFYLSKNDRESVASLAKGWLSNHFAHRLVVFNHDAVSVAVLTKGAEGEVKVRGGAQGLHYRLNQDYLDKLGERDEMVFAQFSEKENLRWVELIVFSKVLSSTGRLVGYIEELVRVDRKFLQGLKTRINAEILLFDEGEKPSIASHEDLELYDGRFFTNKFKEVQSQIFPLTIQTVPYGFMIRPMRWGQSEFFMVIGASKEAVKEASENINVAFFWVVGAIIALVGILSVIIARFLLKPLNDLVGAIENWDPENGTPIDVPSAADTELGVLAESFNELSARVDEAQKKLKTNINELEQANTEIRDTQARLVHAAKMASLGQLVAGVAHELNNPIGFIYSNMTHLREYSDKLIKLVNQVEENPKTIKKLKEEIEFDYIVDDMPKLIQSCEDGARRTRDIVIGLRNFSRLEQAKVQEVNIHEGIDETLSLLSGEIKNRITISKKYGTLPKLMVYPSQLNQVFMNILSNAAHAIEGEGEITIATKMTADGKAEIRIKDTGKGMPKDVAEKIFDPFFTTKANGKGTGLGMSISYGIIQKHGGDIQVHSEPGAGTEFIITLGTAR